MQPTTPPRLYKYSPASAQSLSNLSSAKIWFADPTTFNDPFDCALDSALQRIDSGLTRIDPPSALEVAMALKLEPALLTSLSRKTSAEITNDAIQGLKIAIRKILETVPGVCCFSTKFDDLLMWGHYADCHRGFCLGFDTRFDPFDDPEKCRSVKYLEMMPPFDPREIAKGNQLHATEFLLAKSKCWSYEDEWRILHKQHSHSYSYARETLAEIYFGAKMPEDVRLMIAALLSRTDTKLFEMKLDAERFCVRPETRQFTPTDYRSRPE